MTPLSNLHTYELLDDDRTAERPATADRPRRWTGRRINSSRALALPLLPADDAPDRPRVASADRARRSALLAADMLAVLAALAAVAWVTKLPLTAAGVLVAVATSVAFVRLTGLHDKDTLVLRRSTLDEAPRLLELSAFVACAYWLTLPQGPGRAPLLILAVVLVIGLMTFRTLARAGARRLGPTERCLFIGDMSVADTIRTKVSSGRLGAVVVGALPLHETATARDFGGIAGLRRIVREADITRIILAPVSLSGADTLELVRVAKEAHVRVSIFPRLFEVIGTAVEYEEIEGLTLMGVRRFGLSPASRSLKRGFDLVGAGAALVACAPLIAAICVAIKLDGRGRVLFRQTRVGRDGEPFQILKFRSMVTDAEDLKTQLRERNETHGLFKIAADPRVTRVGRVLRRTSLDELPQFINVLRGEMSLVGPRPLVVDEDLQVLGLDRRRLHLTPGMTGPWQILRSGRVPMREMVSIDYLYVASWSLWTDVKVLLRTVSYVLARAGV